MSGSYLVFALRRVVAAVAVAIAVSAITFVMLRVLRPEVFQDPRPLLVELGDFLWGAFTQFELGNSREAPNRPVGDLIREGLPADLALFAGALVVGTSTGIAAGVAAARHPRGWRARLIGLAGAFALCAPVYWVGLMAILLFGDGIGVIASIGLFDTDTYVPLTSNPLAWFGGLLVPWCVAGAPLAAICMRMTAAMMHDASGSDFVRTAFGKGLTARAVEYRHTLPAAVSPTLSLAGAYTPLLVGNALLVEQVFNIPGAFRLTTGAISNGDFEVLQGLVIVGALLVVAGNLATDLVLGRLDPRTRT